MSEVFRTVPCIASGREAFDRIGELAAGLGGRALIVTGRQSMQSQGVLTRARTLLERAGLACEVHEGVAPEPTVEMVDAAREALQACRAEVVLGIGGGSVLDVAKSAAALARESSPTREYLHGTAEPEARPAAFIACPSTFGTGSEATPNAVLTDPAAKVKKSLRGSGMLPDAAVVDSALGRSAPPKVKAESGIDALTQAIESFFSRHATPLTESLSFGAVALLASSLEEFVFSTEESDHALNVASGSLMAGMALANARLGLVHGLAHPIGARSGAGHGRICGALLPHAIRFNADAAEEQVRLLTGVVGMDLSIFCDTLLSKLGLPRTLADLGLSDDDLEAIAAESLESGSMRANPRTPMVAELKELLARVCAR
jgi:alcohol dehydrogenase class IV